MKQEYHFHRATDRSVDIGDFVVISDKLIPITSKTQNSFCASDGKEKHIETYEESLIIKLDGTVRVGQIYLLKGFKGYQEYLDETRREKIEKKETEKKEGKPNGLEEMTETIDITLDIETNTPCTD